MRRNAALHRAPDVDDTAGELARRHERASHHNTGAISIPPRRMEKEIYSSVHFRRPPG